jgi:hypothetical protein
MVRDVPTILELLKNRSANSVNSLDVTEQCLLQIKFSHSILHRPRLMLYMGVTNSLTIFTLFLEFTQEKTPSQTFYHLG